MKPFMSRMCTWGAAAVISYCVIHAMPRTGYFGLAVVVAILMHWVTGRRLPPYTLSWMGLLWPGTLLLFLLGGLKGLWDVWREERRKNEENGG